MRGRLNEGFVQVFTGSGHGKSLAALGLAVQASTYNYRVYIIHFLRGNGLIDEMKVLERWVPGLLIEYFGRFCNYIDLLYQGLVKCEECKECYINLQNITETDKQNVLQALKKAEEIIKTNDFSIVILDDILTALAFDLIKLKDVENLLELKPANLELILTGSELPSALREGVHRVTEFKQLKDTITANSSETRRGLDY